MTLGVVAGRKWMIGVAQGEEWRELCVRKHSSMDMEVPGIWVERWEGIVT